MKCQACGYDSVLTDPESLGKPFLELDGVETGPCYYTTGPDSTGFAHVAIPRGRESVRLYACPECGTVKIEVL